jgi:hypothetical protein
MALPWMESVRVWGDEAKSTADSASQAPVRVAVLFAGNGFHSKEWWARGEKASMELGQVLAPLHPHREKLLFVRGLYNAEATKGNIHSSQTGNLLSGAPLAPGGDIRSGTSFDQLLAQTYGRRPLWKSIRLLRSTDSSRKALRPVTVAFSMRSSPMQETFDVRSAQLTSESWMSISIRCGMSSSGLRRQGRKGNCRGGGQH